MSSDDEPEDVLQMTGSALPNSLESALSVFPLGDRQVAGHKRKRDESTTDTKTEDVNEEAVLFPSEDAILGNAMLRVNIEEEVDVVAAVDDGQRPSKLRRRAPAPPSLLQQRLTAARCRRAARGMLRLRYDHNKEVEAVQRFEGADICYKYENPNELGVRLRQSYKLYQYQLDVIRWVASRENGECSVPSQRESGRFGSLLAMPMGLGKSVCAGSLVASTLAKQRQSRSCTLYVCPKNLLGTVLYEMEKFFGDSVRTVIYHKDFLRSYFVRFGVHDIRQHDMIITNYATVVKRFTTAARDMSKAKNDADARLIAGARRFCDFEWYRVILDESHEIRTQGTQRYSHIMKLKSRRRLCMTGTPYHNSVIDVFSQLGFCGCAMPDSRHLNIRGLRTLGYDRLARFVEFEETNVELPPKHVHTVFIDLDDRARYVYNALLNRARRYYLDGPASSRGRGSVYASMTRALQVCSAPYLVTPESRSIGKDHVMENEDSLVCRLFQDNAELSEWLRTPEGGAGSLSAKFRRFVALMRQIEGKVVVFANWTATIRMAIRAMEQADPTFEKRHVFVHGGIPSSQKRDEMFTAFRTKPGVQVLFMTLKLGSVGLNLSEANNVIFLEPWYSYSAMIQGEGRVHRIGQVRTVNVYYLLTKETVEENVYRIAEQKRKQSEHVQAQTSSSALDFDTRRIPDNDLRQLLDIDSDSSE